MQMYFYQAFQKISQNMKSVHINSREQQQQKNPMSNCLHFTSQ